MKKVDSPSDTVFLQNLTELLSSETHNIDQNLESDPVLQSPTTRPKINFPKKYKGEKKGLRTDLVVRIAAAFGALGIVVYLVWTIILKM
jgi:hypothetical protein